MREIRRYLFVLVGVLVAWAAMLFANPHPPAPDVVTRPPSVPVPKNPPPGNRIALAQAQPSSQSSTTPCLSLQPGPDWVCQNGTWQLGIGTTNSGASGSGQTQTGVGTTPGGANGAGGCLGVQPGAGWVCQNGAWTQPTAAPNTTTPPGSTQNGSNPGTNNCLGTPPDPSWTCQYGIWTAPSSTTTTPTSTANPGPAGDQPLPSTNDGR